MKNISKFEAYYIKLLKLYDSPDITLPKTPGGKKRGGLTNILGFKDEGLIQEKWIFEEKNYIYLAYLS